MFVTVCCQDTTMTVGCYTIGSKWFVLGMTGVSSSEFPVLINHKYCTSLTDSYTEVMVFILIDVF